MLYEKTALQQVAVSYSLLNLQPEYSDHTLLSDKLLWNAFRRGDEYAFVKIYNNYYQLLYEFGCKYSADKELVRDCLHDFFIYLKKNRLGFGETTSIKMYLFKSFKRRVVDYLKKDSRVMNVTETSGIGHYPVELSIETVYINKQVKAEQLERLNKALDTLDKKERAAIYYFYYKGMSYEQISDVFKFSHVSSARRVIYRGLRQLRSYFSYS